MEATRFRLVGLLEWLIAAACALVVLVGGAAMSGEFQRVRPVMPVIAGAVTAPVVPANVPPGAISIPELVLADGKVLTVGMPSSALGMLGPLALAGPVTIDRIDSDERESRLCRYAGLEFVVVTVNGGIVAIYR
jgi:hypothetical protein